MMEKGENPILQASDFRLVSLLGVLFSKIESFSFSRAMRAMGGLSTLFDSEPTVLGEMPGMPDVPRLLYQSSTGEWRANIGPARCDVFWSKPDSSTETLLIADIAAKIHDVLQQYRSAAGVGATRCALVATRVAAHARPGVFLARHFCQERWMTQPLNRPASFELHAHKQYELSGLALNSWLRAKSGVMKRAQKDDAPIVLIEQDLNTSEKDDIITDDSIRRFFQIVPGELDQILGLYFPGRP